MGFQTSGEPSTPPTWAKAKSQSPDFVDDAIFRYGWRYQIGPWVHAGYRVVVPDMLGYGGTDKPRAADEYSTKKLCADLAALLDVIGVSKAVSAFTRRWSLLLLIIVTIRS